MVLTKFPQKKGGGVFYHKGINMVDIILFFSLFAMVISSHWYHRNQSKILQYEIKELKDKLEKGAKHE